MTRLISEWVSPMLSSMEAYNRKLKEIAGCDLCGLVGDIFGADEASFTSLQRQINVGIVPITQGEGLSEIFPRQLHRSLLRWVFGL